MRLELEVLDGPQKGRKITLTTSLIYGHKSPLNLQDAAIAEMHFKVFPDHKNMWNLNCLDNNVVRIGSAEVQKVSLLKGLVFHVGQTGFKVVERPPLAYESVDDSLKDFLDQNRPLENQREFFFFLNPLRLTFVQGLQLGEFYTLSYGPRFLGHNHLDLNIKDPNAPLLVARFFQIGDQAYIENLAGDRTKINGKPFVQHPISDGDLIALGNDIIELSIL